MLRPLSTLLLALAIGSAWGETLEERIKATDMGSADSVFELAQWCSQNNLPTKARQYYQQVLRIDKDHEPTRTVMGQVKVGNVWVSAKDAGVDMGAKGGKDGAPGAPPPRVASGPGPTAAQVQWDLRLPEDPEPEATWINTYIDRLSSVANDSRDMDVSIATMLADEHVAIAAARLPAALMRPNFNDLYGASSFAMELLKKGDAARAKRLLPFLAKASERVTDAEDLATFAYAAGMLKDKRVVPRLIELLGHGDDSVRDAAGDGLSGVTLLPRERIDVASAQAWWDLNHSASDQQTYMDQLNSRDPKIAVEAAKALYDFRERAIMPVLIRLLRSDDRMVCGDAIGVIQRVTGNGWSYDPNGTPEHKKKISEQLDTWWKEEQFRFRWVEDNMKQDAAATPTAQADPTIEWVRQLSSVKGNEASTAETNLLGAGMKAVQALIGGLEDSNRLVRRKCHDLLTRITKQQIPFDAAAADADRAKGVEAWKAWAATAAGGGTEDAGK